MESTNENIVGFVEIGLFVTHTDGKVLGPSQRIRNGIQPKYSSDCPSSAMEEEKGCQLPPGEGWSSTFVNAAGSFDP